MEIVKATDAYISIEYDDSIQLKPNNDFEIRMDVLRSDLKRIEKMFNKNKWRFATNIRRRKK